MREGKWFASQIFNIANYIEGGQGGMAVSVPST